MDGSKVSDLNAAAPLPGGLSTVAQRRLSQLLDIADLAQPLLQVLALILASRLASVLYGTLLQPPDFAPVFMNPYERWAASAAVFAPFVLHWPSTAARRLGTHPLRELAAPYSAFAALAVFVTLVSGALPRAALPWQALWLGLGFCGVVALRAAFPHRARRETVAVVGAGPATDRLVRHLQRQQGRRVELIGVFDDRATRAPAGSVTRTGPVASLLDIGKKRRVDWILVALPDTAENRVLEVVNDLKSLAVSVGLCPCGIELDLPHPPIDYIAGYTPVTLLAERPIKRWGAVIKGIEDYVLGGLLTLALLPLMGLIALAIRIESPGPVLFRQRRHAWNNAEFEVFKFRSMRWSPPGDQQPLVQTERDDPRITPLGRFLRRSSLDELPQLFNVLRGEMSLVGPRPHAVNMRTEDRLGEEIVATYAHRHRVKPGLTGWAQVNGCRGATQTAAQLRRRIELDLEYIENWSIWFDLRILLMTTWIVVRGTNAY